MDDLSVSNVHTDALCLKTINQKLKRCFYHYFQIAIQKYSKF